MKAFKRVLSFLLATLLLLPMLCMTVFANISFVARGVCGDNATWTLSDTGVLTISGTGQTYAFGNTWATVPGWAVYANDIKYIVIEEGITGIGKNSFNILTSSNVRIVYSNIKSVTIPKSLRFIAGRILTDGEVHVPDLTTWMSITYNPDTYPSCISGNLYIDGELLTQVVVPDDIIRIYPDVFYNCKNNIESVVIHENVLSIGSNAFYGFSSMKTVTFLGDVGSIASTAFGHCGNMSIVCYDDCYNVIKFAQEQNIPYTVLPSNVEVSFENNKVCVTNTKLVKSISYAKGIFNTTTIYNAKGCKTFQQTDIEAESKNGIFFFNLPTESGDYTVLVKTRNSQYKYFYTRIQACEHSFGEYIYNNDATCTKDGTKSAICKYCGIIDTVPVEESAMGHTLGEWIVSQEPTYDSEGYKIQRCTVCDEVINTESIDRLKQIVTATEKGMQFKIENLESVKSIRYAYGEHETEKDIKYGEGAVSHSAKLLRKRGDSCVLQFLKPGLVSIVVTYNDGTRDFYKYDVVKSEPTVTRDGSNNITFGNLSDLKVLRYVKGEFESSYDIKRATGAVAINGKNINSDTYIVTLDRETYTFCVQYNDESYNYYVTGVCGDNLTWVYDMQTATLTISGEGEMDNYYKNRPWDEYLSEIKSIIFEPGITSIGTYSFNRCVLLESVTIPDSVIIIDSYSFMDCSNLKSVVIGDGVTEIWEGVFENCISLTDVKLGKNVQMIYYCAFQRCTSLYNIDLPKHYVEIAEDAFTGTGYFNNKNNWENGLLYLGEYLLDTDYSVDENVYSIVVKEGTIAICEAALDLEDVDYVYLPKSLTYIYSLPRDDDTIYMVYEGSYAHKSVLKKNRKYQIISEE